MIDSPSGAIGVVFDQSNSECHKTHREEWKTFGHEMIHCQNLYITFVELQYSKVLNNIYCLTV